MNDERLQSLIEALLDERLSASDQAELVAQFRSSAEARRLYWKLVEQDALLQDVVCESAGRDLARMAANDLSIGQPLGQSSVGQSSVGQSSVGQSSVGQSSVGQSSATPAAIRTSKAAWPLGRGLAAAAILLALGLFLVGNFFQTPSLRHESAKTGEPTATLSSLAGEVWLTDARQKLVKVASAQAFYAGDRLHVGEASAAEVTLIDGTRVVLNADSVLHIQQFDAFARTLRLERGSADVEAAPQSPDRPLVIITEQARLTVLGTQFRLYASDSDSRVELEEGKVQFERQSDGQTVLVAEGQYAVADAESARPLEAEALSSAWRLRHTLHRAGSRVAFSHDGAKLATASGDRVKLWDAATGEPQQMVDKVGGFDCLAFAPTNAALVALGISGKVLYWPLDAESPRSTELKIEAGRVRSCAVTHDGRWLAQTSNIDAGYLPIWQVDDAGETSLVRSIPMKMGSVAIAATSNGPRVVAGNWNGTTVIWDAESGSELARYRFRSQLHVLALSDEGRQLCGYGNATGLLILDTESGEQSILWPSGSAAVTCLRFSRDGRELIAAMADGLVRGWSTETGEATFVLPTGDARSISLAISNDGRSLATVGDKGIVKLWQREE